ncbi:MAG: histidine kinase [Candidatus Cloacimonadota bacterium]|nr:histidine kinase [Candidatus Cloacimonadota bacterium]
MKKIMVFIFFIMLMITLSAQKQFEFPDNVYPLSPPDFFIPSTKLDIFENLSAVDLDNLEWQTSKFHMLHKFADTNKVIFRYELPNLELEKPVINLVATNIIYKMYIGDKIYTNQDKFFNKIDQVDLPHHANLVNIDQDNFAKTKYLYILIKYQSAHDLRNLFKMIIGEKTAMINFVRKDVIKKQIFNNLFFFTSSILIIVSVICLVIFIMRFRKHEYFFLLFAVITFLAGLTHWLLSPYSLFITRTINFPFQIIGFNYYLIFILLLFLGKLFFKPKYKFIYNILTIILAIIPILLVTGNIKFIRIRYLGNYIVGFILIIMLLSLLKSKEFNRKIKIIISIGFFCFLLLITLDIMHILDFAHMFFTPLGIGIAILAIVFGIVLIEHYNNIMIELEEKKIKLLQMEQKNLTSKYNALKNQIDPHFLFNSLGTLLSLIEYDSRQATIFVEELSRVYRYILQIKEKQYIKVQKEIDFTYSFFYLLKQRFHESLKIDIKSSATVSDYYILPLSLQTLLENAVKHNIVSPQNPLNIRIICNEEKLIIINNLQPKRQRLPSHRLGLKNLQERYNLIMKKSINIIKTPKEFRVELPLRKEVTNENSNS